MKLSVAVAAAAYSACCAAAACGDANAKCCRSLAKQPSLQGKVYLPGTDAYKTRLGQYYSANAALAPTCMVLPTSTEDVSLIASTIHKNKCSFGMRSGGHSAFAGSNSVDKGVTVDFGHLNSTTYSEGADFASIQTGSDWGHAYTALDPFNKTVAGGRASVVGVGGFITGGGYSFHSSAVGFGCDTVRNFEIVLADGKVINANEKENVDLFKAQKGGSGNFGFITRVDMDIQETSQLWAGFVTYEATEVSQLLQTYIDFVDNMESDLSNQALLGIIANETPGIKNTALVSNSKGLTQQPIFKGFLDIPNAVPAIYTDSINKIVPVFTGPTPLGLFSNWIVEMYASDIRVLNFIYEGLERASAKMRAAAPGSVFQVLLELQPVTKSIVRHGVERGGNVLGLESVVADGPAVMFLIALTVDTAANQEIILPLALEYRDEVDAYAASLGLNKNWQYAPYAYGKDQSPLSHYGAENIKLMQKVSSQYDPQGMFQTLRASGFKVPTSS